MPAPSSIAELLELAQKSGVVDDGRLSGYIQQLRAQNALPAEPGKLAGLMVRDGLLTFFQAEQLLMGRWKRFTIGKYRVLERLGSGGMGQVFLCEHKMMRRRVAVKVLPTAKADDQSSLQRFQREARVVGALDHVNIVRAYDIDQDDQLHFLVLEYVDGISLLDLVKKFGPMDPLRACHYINQAALGLQHAFDEAGIIHRDIKPGNVMVDRQGVVKILDMGLARFFRDEEDLLSKQYDETVLGTADYLAPEQAIDSHGVDIRADIYSLGATFYFMLTGSPPFADGTIAQKLIWHQTREPKPVREIRPDVPEEVAAILEKMMAKKAEDRYQTPNDLAAALEPLITTPIPPPPESEMPRLSPAAMGTNGTATSGPPTRVIDPPTPAPVRKPSRAELTLPTTVNPAASAPQSPRPRPTAPRAAGGQIAPAPGPLPPSPPMTAPKLPAPKVETQRFEETPIWSNIASETPGPMASQADTRRSPRKAYKAQNGSQPIGPGSAGAGTRSTGKNWLALIAVGVLLGILAIAALIALGAFRSKKDADRGAAPHQAGGQILVVDTSAAPEANSLPRVGLALARAKSGDRIVVRGPAVEEEWTNVESNRLAKGLTIEADIPAGQYIPWRLPATARDSKAVLTAANMDGLKFKGFAFDGQGRAENGLYIHSRCPGVSFEDCRVMNCRDAALKISHALGEAGRPIAFTRVHFSGGPTNKGVVYLFASPQVTTIKANQHVAFEDCIVEGPGNALILIEGSTDHLTFNRNRLFQGTDGIAVHPLKDSTWSQISFTSNTFYRIVRNALSFDGPGTDAAGDGTSFRVRQNYFAACKTLVSATGEKPPSGVKFEDNGRDAASAEGNVKLDAKIAESTWQSENPNDAKLFLRPASDLHVNDKFVGYHP